MDKFPVYHLASLPFRTTIHRGLVWLWFSVSYKLIPGPRISPHLLRVSCFRPVHVPFDLRKAKAKKENSIVAGLPMQQ